MPNVRSVADLAATIARNLWRIDRTAFDAVVGIPRSGMIPASIIATALQLPLASVDEFVAGIIAGRSGRRVHIDGSPRILLVDDSCNKGGAMGRAVDALARGIYAKHSLQITRLAVYAPYQLDDPARHVDITFEECRGPRIFAWNMWKHKRLPRWAFDMDGVLCRDPRKDENDDGDAYLRFIAEADPLFLPLRPIGHIVTSRLEKYREPTIEWLRKHRIEFRSLTMLDLPNKRARMTAMKVDGGRGGWKARQIETINRRLATSEEKPVEMMIESCPRQAKIIARMARIPVYCTQTQQVFDVDTVL